MTATLWLPPLVRALATALLVVTASAMAEILGPFWGALIASLPVSSGPAYVFLAMQHGVDFVAVSALSSFAANAATAVFLAVYGLLAPKIRPWRGLGVALLAWLASALATQSVTWTPLTALLLNLAVYGLGFVLLDATPDAGPTAASPARRRWLELPVRAVAVAAFVTFVVMVSSALGPAMTGIVAVFPISLTSLIVIVRPRIGSRASAILAANALRSMLGFGLMLLAFHLALRRWDEVTAFLVAFLVSAGWSVALLLQRRMKATKLA